MRFEKQLYLFSFTAILVFFGTGIFFGGLIVLNSFTGKIPSPLSDIGLYTSHVGCGSNSMGLTLRCGDELYMQPINNNDPLYPGRIYTYDSGNVSIVHRLVACLDENCSLVVFKGDNNEVAEIVNRSQITDWVVKVAYH